MLINLTFYFLLNINCGGFFSIIFLKVLDISNLFILIIVIINFLWFFILALKNNFINFILISSGVSGKNRLMIALKLLISFFKIIRSIFQIFKNRYDNSPLSLFEIFFIYFFLFTQYLQPFLSWIIITGFSWFLKMNFIYNLITFRQDFH